MAYPLLHSKTVELNWKPIAGAPLRTVFFLLLSLFFTVGSQAAEIIDFNQFRKEHLLEQQLKALTGFYYSDLLVSPGYSQMGFILRLEVATVNGEKTLVFDVWRDGTYTVRRVMEIPLTALDSTTAETASKLFRIESSATNRDPLAWGSKSEKATVLSLSTATGSTTIEFITHQFGLEKFVAYHFDPTKSTYVGIINGQQASFFAKRAAGVSPRAFITGEYEVDYRSSGAEDFMLSAPSSLNLCRNIFSKTAFSEPF